MIANSLTTAAARSANGNSAGTGNAGRLVARARGSETVRTWDGEQPWLGHGPPIPGANMREVLAVIDQVSDLCGPQGNARALPSFFHLPPGY